MTENEQHIVIVEDDVEISRLTTMLLESDGYCVSQVYRGDEAVAHIRQCEPAAVILDIMLPGLNGIDVCAAIREFYTGPILMLTGVDDDISEISSFKNGADDFVTKPFKPYILTARLQAILRRCATTESSAESLSTADIVVYFAHREVRVQGEILNLTTAEFDLLSLLIRNMGDIVSRDQCCSSLRGISYNGFDRSIDMKISALRKKLNAASKHKDIIKTVRGKGYMLVKESPTHV